MRAATLRVTFQYLLPTLSTQIFLLKSLRLEPRVDHSSPSRDDFRERHGAIAATSGAIVSTAIDFVSVILVDAIVRIATPDFRRKFAVRGRDEVKDVSSVVIVRRRRCRYAFFMRFGFVVRVVYSS